MTDLVDQAETLSGVVHQSQLDKAGMPYAKHPLRVKGLTASHPDFPALTELDQEVALCVALLHDVIEDSPEQPVGPITGHDLRQQGFPEEVVRGVILLSRDSSHADQTSYYRKIRENRIARMVKLADIADNRNKDRQRLLLSQGITPNEPKYLNAIDQLELTHVEKTWMESAIQVPVSPSDP